MANRLSCSFTTLTIVIKPAVIFVSESLFLGPQETDQSEKPALSNGLALSGREEENKDCCLGALIDSRQSAELPWLC
ncbi:unnamed protein product [Protopolystoma xenopodis]|uniref:Uncharacterized protein n=1 Tax=Protopolystoma xenopodis TaxID=117903 RepID=A0A448XHX1_9PLAT|nr:unnamed protein product [Protopolystoma xenopodis]